VVLGGSHGAGCHFFRGVAAPEPGAASKGGKVGADTGARGELIADRFKQVARPLPEQTDNDARDDPADSHSNLHRRPVHAPAVREHNEREKESEKAEDACKDPVEIHGTRGFVGSDRKIPRFCLKDCYGRGETSNCHT